MGCRCSDIRKCQEDIDRINNVKDILVRSKRVNDDFSQELNDLSAKSQESFSVVNMGTLKNEEIILNKDITDTVPELIQKCSSKIDRLHREYTSMKSEDRSYHRRKRRHSD